MLIVLCTQNSEEADFIAGFLDQSAGNIRVRVAFDTAQLAEKLEIGPDVLVVSLRAPGFTCGGVMDVFSKLKQVPPVVFVGEPEDELDVLDFLQYNAADFAFRDQLQHLKFAVFAAHRNSRLLKQAGREIAEQDTFNQLLNLQTAVDQSASTILITSPSGEIEYVNPAFERITGYSKSEVLGKSPKILKSGYHPPEFYSEMWDQISSGKIWQGKMCNRRKDGVLYWESATIAPVRDAHGVITRFVAVKEDITSRKAADDEVRASAERFERLARQSRTYTWEADPNAVYTYVSDLVEEVLGYSPAELIGKKHVYDLHPKEGFEEFRDEALAILARRESVSGYLNRAETKDGRLVWLLSTAVPIFDNQNNFLGYQGHDTDVTERQNMEEQFLRSQRMESIGTLAGGIAHDLNNVLAPILMSIEILKMDETSEDKLEMLGMIESSAKRGSDMVRQVLSFARGVEGRKIVVQPTHIVKELGKIIHETFPKTIQLDLQVAPGIAMLRCDPTQLHQVLLNLCVNARDAMPDGGRILFKVENLNLEPGTYGIEPEFQSGPHVKFTVEDTGIGITSEILSKIFDPFFTTKEAGKGTGLGLPSAMAIIKNHGGVIHVSSKVGRGTRMEILLPAIHDESPLIEDEDRRKAPRGNGETILLVDDEASIRMITAHTLEAFGYKVLSAEDGGDGLKVFEQNSDDIQMVLTDIMMPVMGGSAMVTELRTRRPHLPVIAMSGLNATLEIDPALDEPAVCILQKPFDADVLLVEVRKALDCDVQSS